MKLRTAYFCKKCDEEILLENYLSTHICHHCGYKNRWGLSMVYEWKVEDKEQGEKVE